MKVLFSPIGSTDPISNCRDGGMLHICRLYRPDKVYFYLSSEMCIYHDMDDRYRGAVRLLEAETGWQCEIEVIRDEEMENVQLFDAFINSFERILDNIRKRDKPESLMVNISSGTPAMKCSLQMISMLWNDIVAIQVSTPLKSSNWQHEDKDHYDLGLQWEKNRDREDVFENRCMVSDVHHLLDRIRKEHIQKYIEVYDYEAAKMMAKTLYQEPSENFEKLLDIAIARQKLDLKYVNTYRQALQLQSWFPIVQERKMKEYEYLLAMQTKLWKKQYADFIKDVTPIFYSFSEEVLWKCCGLHFADIGEKKDSAWNLSIDKLRAKRIKPKTKWGDHTNISSYIVLTILNQLGADKEIIQLMDKIRLVEREVRNLAAHQIVGVTREWIKKRTKYTPEEIMDMLFLLSEYAGNPISRKNREIYRVMNEDLLRCLSE